MSLQAVAWLENHAIECQKFRARMHPRHCSRLQAKIHAMDFGYYDSDTPDGCQFVALSHYRPCRGCPHDPNKPRGRGRPIKEKNQ